MAPSHSNSTRTLFRQFAKARNKKPTASTPASKSTAAAAASPPTPSTPTSPRDIIVERKEAFLSKDHTKSESSLCSSTAASPRTLETKTSTLLTALEAPALHHPVISPHSPSGNVSLADSSITTEVAFSLPNITLEDEEEVIEVEVETPQRPATVSERPSCSSPVPPSAQSSPLRTAVAAPTTPACTITPATTTTPQSTYQPRSLKDLVRRDLRSTDAAVVERALHQITLDCWDKGTARSLVARAGGVLSILTVLEDYQGHVNIQVAACHALAKLSLDADNELAVAELGGLDILWRLATASSSPRVSQAAWAALQNCTCQLQDWETDMSLWAQVLSQQPSSAVAHAAATAANLCVADKDRTATFGQAGGLVAMAQALQENWHDPDVRADVASSLARVCDCVASMEEAS